ncbi:MAG: response regulator transcription factor [Stigonema ocellatum SAG 48.90 = DSM 106950]|nr:response regulator transcription factor [Stigonema ocellatum SAG 48.90 = DSM 106950]
MSQDFLEQKKLKILVVDDHELILDGTLDVLSTQYPEAEIITVQTAQDVIAQLQIEQPDLAVVDLSIPEKPGMTGQIDTGIQLIQNLMKNYPFLNLMVQSSYVKALVRIRHDIDNHQGGFVVADKGLSKKEMLARVNLALQLGTHTKDLGIRIEVKPEWLEVLRLAFEEGLTDRAIAERMIVAERTVRNYWTKIQDVLGIYSEYSKKDRKNIRIETEIRAREKGLID